MDNNSMKHVNAEEKWKKKLTPEQYRVMRGGDTEPPFSGQYVHTDQKGVFHCAACGAELFSSDAKFDSGTGWPSFTEPMNREAIELREDTSHGPPSPDGFGRASVQRVEVRCKRCGSHLGHVFDDLPLRSRGKAGGPGPTGTRYCINSVALDMEKPGSAPPA